MTLTEHVLRGAMLEARDPNRLRVGLPWFRSVPFSALVGLELIVDGRPFAAGDVIHLRPTGG